jgi:hypothetical protein
MTTAMARKTTLKQKVAKTRKTMEQQGLKNHPQRIPQVKGRVLGLFLARKSNSSTILVKICQIRSSRNVS